MNTTPLHAKAIQALLAQHPRLPTDYLDYLRNVGWGETASGCMIYSAPIAPEDVYGEVPAAAGVLLLGDDMAGHALGFDTVSARYGEVTPDGQWRPWPADEGLASYVMR